MLVLAAQKLVVLEAPKTGSLALRAMLAPFIDPLWSQAQRHTGIGGYQRYHSNAMFIAFGSPAETVAVMREPLRRMQSWYRYRLRKQLLQTPNSTSDVSFEQFIEAYLQKNSPAFARVGRQDRFVGWDGQTLKVDHLFDYRQLDKLTKFLSKRIGQNLELPYRNVSPEADQTDYTLSDAVLARFLERNKAEFTLYSTLRKTGYLKRKLKV